MARDSARRRIWGWMMFDWATQPFYTLLLTFVFGPYFAAVATQFFMDSGMTEAVADARAQSIWSLGQTVTGLFIAFTAPLLGALKDFNLGGYRFDASASETDRPVFTRETAQASFRDAS